MLLLFNTFILSEHPTEHPSEHPAPKKVEAPKVTIDDLANAITKYITDDSKLKGGYFVIFDPAEDATLTLTLDKVHKDKLSKVYEDVYFACVDLKTKDGEATYDLDFFMKKTDSGFEISEVSIHKKNGEARYNWVEENGIWKKKAVELKKQKKESGEGGGGFRIGVGGGPTSD